MNWTQVLNILKQYCRRIFSFNKRANMRYPDIKNIVEHIYHDYMTRCDIIILQNKMIAQAKGGVTAWCDECWLNDFAEDLKSAFDRGCFIDVDEDKVALLKKEIESVKPTLCVCLGNRANSIMYDVITETEYPELLISSITLPHLSGTARGAIVKQFEKQLKGMRATANNIAEVYAKEIIDKINGGSRKS